MANKSTILAVDDDPVILKAIHNILASKYDLLTINSASNAINFLNSRKADVILLDIEMPNISGFNFLEDIRRIPSYMATPIIIISGKEGEDFKTKARNSTAFDVLGKPVDPDTLIAVVEKALAQKNQGFSKA